MKKILFAFATFAASMAVSAQETVVSAQEAVVNVEETVMVAPDQNFKPDEGAFQLEVGIAPLEINAVSLQGGQLKGSYSLNENFGVRLGLGFGMNKHTTDSKEEEWIKTTESTSRFTIAPGVTYSFDGTNKLTPYVGAEILIATTSNKSTYETKSGYKSVTKNAGSPFNTFGFGLFTGFNYYFAKNLFVGVEIGIGVDFENVKNESVEITENGTTTTEESKAERDSFHFSAYANPSLRLGWAF